MTKRAVWVGLLVLVGLTASGCWHAPKPPAASLPGSASPPPPQIKVISFTWKADPNYGRDGEVIWTGEIFNDSDLAYETVEVAALFYAADGSLLATGRDFVFDVLARQTRTVDGFADYTGKEATGKLRIERATRP